MKKILLTGAAMAVMMASLPAMADSLPSREEMWKIIQQQQKQIESLKNRVETTDQKVEATGAMVEDVAARSTSSGEQAGAAGGWWERTHLGGYGELHYNGGDTDQIDFHRFVLELGHEFTDDIRLKTELELEHALAGDGQPGEVELEQAFVEFDLFEDQHQARAGLFLMPVGILNEKHEPTTFFGTERNPVEKNIIPTTWWEGGVGLAGDLGSGFSYDVSAHSGLQTDTTGGGRFKIRGGRQKVASATANDFAYTGSLDWQGMPGVELGVTGQYQADVTQSTINDTADATLLETHADLRRGGWGLRALYARWDINGDAVETADRDEQYGWYVEPSYRWDTSWGEMGVFGRYNEWDNGGTAATDGRRDQIDFGLNYWPHENVVLKADYSMIDSPNGAENDDRLNMGVGYRF